MAFFAEEFFKLAFACAPARVGVFRGVLGCVVALRGAQAKCARKSAREVSRAGGANQNVKSSEFFSESAKASSRRTQFSISSKSATSEGVCM